jgi:hypothetical protein
VAAADRASRGEAKLALSLVTCDAEVGLHSVIRPTGLHLFTLELNLSNSRTHL